MMKPTFVHFAWPARRRAVLTLSAVLLGGVLHGAAAAPLPVATTGALAQAQQRGELVIGVQTKPLPYQAGAKFRTPDGADAFITQQLATRLQTKLTLRAAPALPANSLPQANGADLILAALPERSPLLRSANAIPTGYSTGSMAIMRSDTTIHSWADLKGKVVCVANDGRHNGIGASYGAIEQVYRAPADALLAMRTGECDAAIHDSSMLEELIKLPEWKKFSARLPVIRRTRLTLLVPASDSESVRALTRVTAEWRAKRALAPALNQAVRNIAFEVYLDQNVPDCH